MNDLLTSLKVPAEVQEFFGTGELLFNYGGHFEQYETGYHRVPTTPHLWLAGNPHCREVIITGAAMEAIAFLALNAHKYQGLQGLTFIALGNLPQMAQLIWIRQHYPKRKYTLIFGNDLLGRLADIRVAAGLHGHPVSFDYTASRLGITCRRVLYHFIPEQVSLNAFEKAMGLRLQCRTIKPRKFISFLDQLKYDANQ